jgi:hypothetical protein
MYRSYCYTVGYYNQLVVGFATKSMANKQIVAWKLPTANSNMNGLLFLTPRHSTAGIPTASSVSTWTILPSNFCGQHWLSKEDFSLLGAVCGLLVSGEGTKIDF